MEKNSKATLRGASLYKIPFGRFLLTFSHLHSYSPASTGIIQKTINTQGILFLEGHKTRTDMYATAAVIIDTFNIGKLVMPFAASGYYAPFMKQAISKLNKTGNFALYPVFRKEDKRLRLRNRILFENYVQASVSARFRHFKQRVCKKCYGVNQ